MIHGRSALGVREVVRVSERAHSLQCSFFLDHTQAKSLLNVLNVEEALFLQECSKHTSEHTLD